MRVYLIGFMGSGKSTFGKKLAKRLSWDFIDTDKAIEGQEGMTIPEIFEQKGEAAFRALERQYIQTTFALENVIISCGGGTPCYFDTMDSLLQHGHVLYLKIDEGHLFERLRTRSAKRPLIAGKSDTELKDYIRNTLSAREAFYLKAHQIIDPTSVKAKFVAEQIQKKSEGRHHIK